MELLAELHHSNTYGYQRALGSTLGSKVSKVATEAMLRQLETIQPQPTLDGKEAADELGKLLAEHGIVEDISVTKLDDGFRVDVKNCKLAGKWHKSMQENTLCVWALSVAALLKKQTKEPERISLESQLIPDGSTSYVRFKKIDPIQPAQSPVPNYR